MLRFAELAEPTEGWRLDRIRNRGSGSRAYWEVALIHRIDRRVIEYSHANLEMAWTAVVRAAEARDAQGLALKYA